MDLLRTMLKVFEQRRKYLKNMLNETEQERNHLKEQLKLRQKTEELCKANVWFISFICYPKIFYCWLD